MAKDADDRFFKIENEARARCTLVRITGRLASKNILSARKALEEALTGGQTRICLDLSAVEYMDSMGIGLLVNFSKKVKGAGGSLVLANLSPTAADIIKVSGTGSFLEIHAGLTDPDQAFA